MGHIVLAVVSEAVINRVVMSIQVLEKYSSNKLLELFFYHSITRNFLFPVNISTSSHPVQSFSVIMGHFVFR